MSRDNGRKSNGRSTRTRYGKGSGERLVDDSQATSTRYEGGTSARPSTRSLGTEETRRLYPILFGNKPRGAANDKARADSFLPREQAAGLGGMDAQGPSALEALLERLNSLGSSAAGGISMPDRAAYMSPFDEAERRANEAYGKTVPALEQLYGGLQQNVTARGAETTAAVDRLQAEREAQMGQRLSELAPTMPSQAALVAGGEVATGAAQEQAQSVEALKAQFDAERARGSRLDQVDAQAQTALQQSVEGAKANSTAAARNNLDSILQQIGVERAGAEAAYQDDVRQVQSANADNARRQQEQQRADLEAELDRHLKLQTGIAQMATGSGRKAFEAQVPQLSSAYPRQFRAFNDIVSRAKGKGQMGLASALQVLEEAAPGLQDGSIYGAKFGTGRLKSWLEAYFDEEDRLDPDAFRRLGGDPKALGFLEGGISDPRMMAMLLGGR